MLTDKQKQFIAEQAEGSCLSEWELVVRLFETDEDFDETDDAEVHEAAADHDIYRCETCGWWNEAGDIYNPTICTDCHDDENTK